MLLFLVGSFLVKRARLIQWLVFFRQTFHSSRMYQFCERFTFTKSTQYLILNGLYIQRPLLELQNPEGSPFYFFGAIRLSPPLFGIVRLFFRNFLKSSKAFYFSPFNFFGVLYLIGSSKKPKGPLLHLSAL